MYEEDFYESKYLYYKSYIFHLVIVVALSSVAYYISDCMLFERIEYSTLLPRLLVVIPTVFFILAYKKTDDRILISTLAYIVFHTVILGTLGACMTLPNLNFASEGFVILQFMFVAIGFTMPRSYTMIWQGLSFVEYLIAQPYIHFPDLTMMIILGIPVYIGNCAIGFAMDRTYKDQYESKKALEYAIIHDSLTECYNRNVVTDSSLGLLDDFSLNYSQYSFLLFDLDNFKRINDTYGHNVGDIVLKLVTDAVRTVISDEDYFIRWGGEEFLVITHCTGVDAVELAHKMNRAVEAIEYEDFTVTISIGVATALSANYTETVKVADTAMYKAKTTGKNKACW